jgi:hypothetical protein
MCCCSCFPALHPSFPHPHHPHTALARHYLVLTPAPSLHRALTDAA